MLWFCRMQSTVTAQCLGLNLSQPIQFIKEETQAQRGAFAQGCSLAYAGSMPSLPHTLPFTALPPGRATGLLHSSEPRSPLRILLGFRQIPRRLWFSLLSRPPVLSTLFLQLGMAVFKPLQHNLVVSVLIP